MFSAYMDESYDEGRSGLYTVGAIFGDGWSVLKGEKLWQKSLDKHDLHYFKASKLKAKPDVVKDFAGIIASSGLLAYGITSDQMAAIDTLKGSLLHKRYRESPYMLLHQFAFIDIATQLAKHKTPRSVSYVCDESAYYLGVFFPSFLELKELNPKSKPYMGSCSVAKDQTCIPLQMADLIASELRRAGTTFMSRPETWSPALRILLESKVLFRVTYLNSHFLQSVRSLVDSKSNLSDV